LQPQIAAFVIVPSPLAGEGHTKFQSIRMGEGCSSGALEEGYPSPIRIRCTFGAASPARGEGAESPAGML
jgi:hypothetical protein